MKNDNSNIPEIKTQDTTHLTFEEATAYLKVSKSCLYKKTHRNEIRYYKPSGKLIYFLKKDLDEWIRRNPIKTKEDIDREAIKMVTLKKSHRV